MASQCGTAPTGEQTEAIAETERNRIVGFAAFCRRFEAHTREKRVWVSDLWVAPNQRREGIGRALIAAVQARASELGCAAVDFDVARGNDTARAFYQHLKAVICNDIEIFAAISRKPKNEHTPGSNWGLTLLRRSRRLVRRFR